MKNLIASVLAASMLAAASTAYAGGPVVIIDEPAPVVAEKPASSVGVLPVVVGVILLCALLCGGNDDPAPTPPPTPTPT